MSNRENNSKRSSLFTAIDNAAFASEYDSSLTSDCISGMQSFMRQDHSDVLLDLTQSNVIPSVSAITESTYLRFNPPNAMHCNRMDPFTMQTTKLDPYDHPPVTMASIGSSTESDGLEPGSATHLLEHERLSTRNLQHRTYPSDLKPSRCPLRVQQVSIQNSSSDVGILRWNWPVIRLGCLVTLVSSLVAMVCVVVGIIIVGPFHCNPNREWWQGAVMYEVFPASFLDTDKDDFGDFRGLIQRLDYIQSLNISILRLSSIFSALDYPLEYEHIIDFINVDPHLGRMEDLNALIDELHARNMYLVLDMNPTLTSDQHTWAAHWLLEPHGEYRYYYINTTESLEELLESEDEEEDQEWTVPHRTFGGWYHLNWSHTEVKLEMARVLEFWVKKGIDGFYFKHLEDLHVDQPEDIIGSIRQWREILDMWDDKRRIMMASIDSFQNLGGIETSLVRAILPYFDLIDVYLEVDGNRSHQVMKQVEETTQWNAPWIHWNVGNVESSRLSSTLDSKYTLASLVLLMMLPGSVSIFYGDEIGLRDSVEETTGKMYREGQLCPMQWTIASTVDNITVERIPLWLPPGHQNPSSNVESQSDRINLISQLVGLRNNSVPIAMNSAPASFYPRGGRTNIRVHLDQDGVLVLERYYPRRHRYVVAANFGPERVSKDISNTLYETVIIIGTNSDRKGLRLNFKDFVIDPGEAFVGELST
ncbi:neutral and basic amino acid transport protein rBAT-like [Centruroides sculpturatus]|uniref:neutral and basic amino acid transport protein rBAT-like n=1 Tax=Centruroides sculpturatus TaxID=218467 RepID=UPI000C6D1642|nr:neutral and basic amino acid transport protein rBAT-like [Centruroides sculpturatus]